MSFNHIQLNLQLLEREHIDGVRFYKIPDEEELIKMVSITSVTSHFNKEILSNGAKKLVMKKQIVSQKKQPVVVQICTPSLSII